MADMSSDTNKLEQTGNADTKKHPESFDRAQFSKTTSKKIILAVDDRPEILTAIVDMLKEDFTIIGVTSGRAALKAIEKHTPEFFILDIEMPQMDGYKLASLIREYERFSFTPIVFLTSNKYQDGMNEAVKHGGNDYLLKPVHKEVLLNKVHQLLKM